MVTSMPNTSVIPTYHERFVGNASMLFVNYKNKDIIT